MTDDYTPLTDEQVARAQRLASGVASISVQPSFIKELVDTIAYWKRRAEAAERRKPAATPRHGWVEWANGDECMHCMALRTSTKPYRYKLPGGDWSSTRPECNK